MVTHVVLALFSGAHCRFVRVVVRSSEAASTADGSTESQFGLWSVLVVESKTLVKSETAVKTHPSVVLEILLECF